MNTKRRTEVLNEAEIDALVSWVPLDFRFGSWATCFYCGEPPDVQDHVIPVSFLTLSKRADIHSVAKWLRTPSCRECNSLLGSWFFDTMAERVESANKSLRRRYKKVLGLKRWDWHEIQQLRGSLRSYVKHHQELNAVAHRRVSWVFSETHVALFEEAHKSAVAEFPENKQLHAFMTPKWEWQKT